VSFATRFDDPAKRVPVAMFESLPDGRLRWVSTRWTMETGLPRPDEPDATWLDSLHPDDRDGVLGAWRAATISGNPSRLRIRLSANGACRTFDVSIEPVRIDGGGTTGLIGTLVPVDEHPAGPSAAARTGVDGACAGAADRLALLAGMAPVGICRLDPAGRYLWANDHLCRMLGRPGDDLAPGYWVDDVHPEDRDAVRAALDEVRGSGSALAYSTRLVRATGGVVRAEGSLAAVRDEAGEVIELLCVLNDVAGRTLAGGDLEDDEALFPSLANHVPVGIFRFGPDRRIAWVNDRFAEIHGARPQDLIGRPMDVLFDVIDAEHRRAVASWEAWARDGARGMHRVELLLRPPGRDPTWISIRSAALRNGEASAGFLGTVADITERRAMEAALRESETLFRTLSTEAPVAIVRLDANGAPIWVNERWVELTGVPADEVLDGRVRVLDVVHPEQRSEVAARWRSWVASGMQVQESRELRVLRADGEVRWVTAAAVALRDEQGRQTGRLLTLADITDLKRTEEALRASEAYLAEAQELAGLGVWELDPSSRVMTCSNNLYEMLGLVRGRATLFEALLATVHPNDVDRVRRTVDEGAQSGVPFEFTFRLYRRDTWEERVLTARARPDPSGRLLGTVVDITEQVEAENRLKRAQEIAHLGSWEWDIPRDGLVWTDEIYRIFGLEPGTFSPTYEAFLERVHPDDRVLVEQAVARALDTHVTYSIDHRLVRPDGSERIVHEQGEATYAPDGTPLRMLGTVHDVTDRARAEQALRASEERFRQLASSAPVGIFETDESGSCVWVNELWSTIAGIPPQSALGAGWVGAIHPEDRGGVVAAWMRAVRDGSPFRREYRFLAPDGRVTWVAGGAIALKDGAGRLSGHIGTIADITERRRADHEHEALGRVAIAVASDMPPRLIFSLVAEEVAQVLGVPAASVVQYEEREQAAIVVGAWPVEPASTWEQSRLALDGPGLVGRVHRARRPVRAYDPMSLDAMAGEGLDHTEGRVCGAAVPVWMGRNLWGAVSVVGERDDLPDDTEERLERFCELLSLALANADTRRQLATLASTDPLTGLPNRRSFEERLAAEVERAKRHDRPLGLVVFDIDLFKEINDAYGHQVGDVVLVELGRRLSDLARAGETVARIGGEEFAWILPETDDMGAYQAAERTRKAIAEHPFETVGTVTVSGGVCDLECADGPSELFRLADVALYWAKSQGRNVVFRYSPGVVELLSAEEQGRRLRRAEALSGLRALARAIDAKDTATQRHSERVADVAERLAMACGWSPAQAGRMREAALVHDIGKIGVRDQVLLKPSALTADECEELKQHAVLGATMIAGLLDEDQVGWVRHHHEWWNGGGYPDAIAGEDIPAGARIMALADAWDAMTRLRSDAPSLTAQQGIEEARRASGGQFDPRVVAALETLWRRGELSTPASAEGLPSPEAGEAQPAGGY
jgi:diguanylate cyclase (GGDEF)-like protein/PAS domain S-box-containing protein